MARTTSTRTSRPRPIQKPPQTRESLWKGPQVDGITFSLLSDFLECRERFRLHTVEGLREDEGFRSALEYGNYWHEAEEAFFNKADWRKAIRDYQIRLRSEYPHETASEIWKWSAICEYQFPHYISKWEGEERKRKSVLQEVAFRIPYTLPSGRSLILRGKFDRVFSEGKSVYLQENKTKGKIDVEGIGKTVSQNLQTMIYLTALHSCKYRMGSKTNFRLKTDEGDYPLPPKANIYGVVYNVVRRPLGDPYSGFNIRQRKRESLKEFCKRAGDEIVKENLDSFFYRWRVRVSKANLRQFQQRCLNPILENLLDWWESIQHNPFDPWTTADGEPNPLHYQSPWGVAYPLASDLRFRGSFFDLLTSGRQNNINRIDTLFPELV